MNCKGCPLLGTSANPCIMGEGNKNAKLMIIAEAPGFESDRSHRPFVGDASLLLDHIFNKLSVPREEIYITNVIKCRPPKGGLPKGDKLEKIYESCWSYLEYELQEVDPKVILILGGSALLMLTGIKFITKQEGMEVETIYEGAKTIACLHPAYVLHSPGREANIARALFKACKIAKIKMKPKGFEAGFFNYELRS